MKTTYTVNEGPNDVTSRTEKLHKTMLQLSFLVSFPASVVSPFVRTLSSSPTSSTSCLFPLFDFFFLSWHSLRRLPSNRETRYAILLQTNSYCGIEKRLQVIRESLAREEGEHHVLHHIEYSHLIVTESKDGSHIEESSSPKRSKIACCWLRWVWRCRFLFLWLLSEIQRRKRQLPLKENFENKWFRCQTQNNRM